MPVGQVEVNPVLGLTPLVDSVVHAGVTVLLPAPPRPRDGGQ